MLADLAPGVGCGALDALRRPKGGYHALKAASQPVHFFMEHDGRAAVALWAVNDLPRALNGLRAQWRVEDGSGQALEAGERVFDLPAGSLVKVADASGWDLGEAAAGCAVTLTLLAGDGAVVVRNLYARPFDLPERPKGYPWNYDPYLGVKVFDRPGARSVVRAVNHPLLRPFAPLVHAVAEWGIRETLPPRVAHRVAQVIELLRRKRPLRELPDGALHGVNRYRDGPEGRSAGSLPYASSAKGQERATLFETNASNGLNVSSNWARSSRALAS
ncbi:MAG: hypothetical protein M5R40_01355 [Anaerolineae bacterium]|nr:hypothetical protein [Anaerolineae bacterium]